MKRPEKILVIKNELDSLEFLHELVEQEDSAVVAIDKAEYGEKLHDGGMPDLSLLDVFLSVKDRSSKILRK
jgi:DNA-binding response OmpR family regulator